MDGLGYSASYKSQVAPVASPTSSCRQTSPPDYFTTSSDNLLKTDNHIQLPAVKMLCKSLFALAAASLALAATPSSFTPGSNTSLIVEYSGKAALNGAVQALACKSDVSHPIP